MAIADQLQQAITAMSLASGDKLQANAFLEEFQKSTEAWEAVHQVLSNGVDPASRALAELKMFAAQTLRSKVLYDLNQIPPSAVDSLKQTVLQLLVLYSTPGGPNKIIRTQLCVLLANLALQMPQWKDPTVDVIAWFGQHQSPHTTATLLEYLKVLPEELLAGRRTLLLDEEVRDRTEVLLTQHAPQVVQLLLQECELQVAHAQGQTSGVAPLAPLLAVLDTLNSWIKEVPITGVLADPHLTPAMFLAVTDPSSLDAATECLVTVLRETRDLLAEDQVVISPLLAQLVKLQPYMEQERDDPQVMEQMCRLVVEAGELWNVFVATNPAHFMPLVEMILACCGPQQDLDVVKITFNFWYMLRQLLTTPRHAAGKQAFAPVYLQLIHYIVGHLQYPINRESIEANNASLDLFEDKEAEDKFKEFRYEMGDALKDACCVVGPVTALRVPYQQILAILELGPLDERTQYWQSVEAPLFSMRAMAQEVPTKESEILPVVMGLLIQLPEHPKIRYATTLVLGRYTEWTAKHPEFLEPQLNYIIRGFDQTGPDHRDVTTAAAHALMYFCQDCSQLLLLLLGQLYTFYGRVVEQLEDDFEWALRFELAEGIGHVLAVQLLDDMYTWVTRFMEPTVQAITRLLQQAGADAPGAIADHMEVLAVYVHVLRPRAREFDQMVLEGQQHPGARVFGDLWLLVKAVLGQHGQVLKVLEKCCKLVKSGIENYGVMLAPILPEVMEVMVSGFGGTKFGCYLWVLGVVVREFADDGVEDRSGRGEAAVKATVFAFARQQINAFFQFLTHEVQSPLEIPDIVDDFYRMMGEVLMFFPFQVVEDHLMMVLAVNASVYALNHLQLADPIIHILHLLIDLVLWGERFPPVLMHDETPAEVQAAVQQLVMDQGAQLTLAVVSGLIYRFPRDAFPDASELLIKMYTLDRVREDASVVVGWMCGAFAALGKVSDEERDRVVLVLGTAVQTKDQRRIRLSVDLFVGWYRRKHVLRRS